MKKNMFAFYSNITTGIAFFTPIIVFFTGISESVYRIMYNNTQPSSIGEHIEKLTKVVKISSAFGAFVSIIAIIFGIIGYVHFKKDNQLKSSIPSIIDAFIIFSIFVVLMISKIDGYVSHLV